MITLQELRHLTQLKLDQIITSNGEEVNASYVIYKIEKLMKIQETMISLKMRQGSQEEEINMRNGGN